MMKGRVRERLRPPGSEEIERAGVSAKGVEASNQCERHGMERAPSTAVIRSFPCIDPHPDTVT